MDCWTYGRRKAGNPVWVNLDILGLRHPDTPRHVNGAGLDWHGQVRGTLVRWIPTLMGDWIGVHPDACDFDQPDDQGCRD